MKYFLTAFVISILLAFTMTSMVLQSNDAGQTSQEKIEKARTLADLSPEEKKKAFEAYANGSCSYDGIELKGKVQFVTSFPDIKIKYVSSFADIHVKMVSSFPDDCGEWQKVSSFPDFKVQVVSSFPDIEVKEVTSFPGMQ